jgi:small subunit ribosomal protein S13
MSRISGVDLPNEKRLDIGLTYLYGIGRTNVIKVLKETAIDPARRIKTLTDEEISKLTKYIETNYKIEGDLRQEVNGNIKRLREIGSYRGMRHQRSLPSRGQRTRSNARTKRGKRATVGAMKKDDRIKQDVAVKPTATPATK